MALTLFLFLATFLSTCNAKFDDAFNPIQLRLHSSAGGRRAKALDCLSWRLAVETNNLQGWDLVPKSCEEYVAAYMLGRQYRRDCELVADAAIEYAKSIKPAGDGKDIWVFDIDETALSNLPYYNRSDVRFGTLPRNVTKFYEWVAKAAVPPLPAALRLYKKVLSIGFKTVIMTSSSNRYRDARIINLNNAGYYNWEKLILKGEADPENSAADFKSRKRTELLNEGYRIVGNLGDQWSDLVGANAGNRTFKLPNPMYYIR